MRSHALCKSVEGAMKQDNVQNNAHDKNCSENTGSI